MAYDEGLARRIRPLLSGRDPVREQKMFGGLAFMVSDRMAVGIVGGDLMVRVGPGGYEESLTRPHTRPMDFTGRPSKGMVYVSPAVTAGDVDLAVWVRIGSAYAASLAKERSS